MNPVEQRVCHLAMDPIATAARGQQLGYEVITAKERRALNIHHPGCKQLFEMYDGHLVIFVKI
jgi:hypothetical protein